MGTQSGVAGTLDVSIVGNAGQLPIPVGAVAFSASSNSVANATAQAVTPASVGKVTYVSGFQVTASGATAGLAVTVNLAGTIGGSNYYTFVFPAGVLVAAQPLLVTFPIPVAASAANTAMSINLPPGGAGNTNATVSIQGYLL